jgi:hypothetical protein
MQRDRAAYVKEQLDVAGAYIFCGSPHCPHAVQKEQSQITNADLQTTAKGVAYD